MLRKARNKCREEAEVPFRWPLREQSAGGTIHGLSSACMIECFARPGTNAVGQPKYLSAPVIVGLCEAHTPQAPPRPHIDPVRKPASLLCAGPARFSIRLNSYAMFNEDPLRSQAGVGAGG